MRAIGFLRKVENGYPAALYLLIVLVFLFANAFKSLSLNALITDSAFMFNWGSLLKAVLFSGIIFLLAIRFRNRSLFAIAYGLQIFYFFCNLSYHFYSQNYIHINQYFALFFETFDLLTHAAVPAEPKLWWVIMDLPAFLGVLILYHEARPLCHATIGRRLYISGYAFVLVLLFMGEVGTPRFVRELMDDEYMSQAEVIKKYGLFVFNIIDFMNYPGNKAMVQSLSRGDTLTIAEKGPSRLNVVMIQIESLDAFAINQKYRNSYVMPYLRSLSKKGIYYPYMLSYHLAGGTSDCEFAIINSVEPLDKFPSIKIRNYEYPNSLARKFNKAGYGTISFHGNRGDYFNRKPAFLRMGFNRFNDMFDLELKQEGWGASDSAVYDRVLDSMKLQPEPFFYYIITMSSHEPFELVKQYYADRRFNSVPGRLSRDYLVSMAYVDRTIEKFVKQIRAIRPNTCIFIYGDHTPGIRNGTYRQSAFYHRNQYFEFVPLIISIPKAAPYKEKSRAITFVDVAPSVLSAADAAGQLLTTGKNLLEYPIDSDSIDLKGKRYDRGVLYSILDSTERAKIPLESSR